MFYTIAKTTRHILSKVSRDHYPVILLGTVKGLLATAVFLEKSRAFTSNRKPYIPPKPPNLREQTPINSHYSGFGNPWSNYFFKRKF